MIFRNLTIFRFPAGLIIEPGLLDMALERESLKPIGPLDLSSRGFVSPTGASGDGAMAYWLDRAVWLAVGGEDKILPSSVVSDLLQKRLAEIEEKEGRRPGGRARKRIKEDIVHELLPKAFAKPSRLNGYLDLERQLVVVDTTSRKAAEGFVSMLRAALGSFPALPLSAEIAPRSVLTSWIAGEPLPEGLSLGDEAVLKDAADKGASIRAARQELLSDEISRHLEAGKQVTRLALSLGDSVSFTVDEDLVVRKLKLLDGAVDKLESTERDDLLAELNARFALMHGEVGALFDVLAPALKIARPE